MGRFAYLANTGFLINRMLNLLIVGEFIPTKYHSTAMEKKMAVEDISGLCLKYMIFYVADFINFMLNLK